MGRRQEVAVRIALALEGDRIIVRLDETAASEARTAAAQDVVAGCGVYSPYRRAHVVDVADGGRLLAALRAHEVEVPEALRGALTARAEFAKASGLGDGPCECRGLRGWSGKGARPAWPGDSSAPSALEAVAQAHIGRSTLRSTK